MAASVEAKFGDDPLAVLLIQIFKEILNRIIMAVKIKMNSKSSWLYQVATDFSYDRVTFYWLHVKIRNEYLSLEEHRRH